MASLYEISKDLLDFFNEIEANEGEITDEQCEQLKLTENELKEKLSDYVAAIKTWEADEKALKEEKQRFNARQNVLKSRIERLKNAALEAVLNFGYQYKTTKFFELPMYRLSTRTTTNIEVDEERLTLFINTFCDYVKEIEIGLSIGNPNALNLLLDAVNGRCMMKNHAFEPFTMEDLLALRLTFSYTGTISELFEEGTMVAFMNKEPDKVNVTDGTSKDNWKEVIRSAKAEGSTFPTIAIEVTNQSLQIK